MRRLHSTAYSIGSVRVIGSMNPLTNDCCNGGTNVDTSISCEFKINIP